MEIVLFIYCIGILISFIYFTFSCNKKLVKTFTNKERKMLSSLIILLSLFWPISCILIIISIIVMKKKGNKKNVL